MELHNQSQHICDLCRKNPDNIEFESQLQTHFYDEIRRGLWSLSQRTNLSKIQESWVSGDLLAGFFKWN